MRSGVVRPTLPVRFISSVPPLSSFLLLSTPPGSFLFFPFFFSLWGWLLSLRFLPCGSASLPAPRLHDAICIYPRLVSHVASPRALSSSFRLSDPETGDSVAVFFPFFYLFSALPSPSSRALFPPLYRLILFIVRFMRLPTVDTHQPEGRTESRQRRVTSLHPSLLCFSLPSWRFSPRVFCTSNPNGDTVNAELRSRLSCTDEARENEEGAYPPLLPFFASRCCFLSLTFFLWAKLEILLRAFHVA